MLPLHFAKYSTWNLIDVSEEIASMDLNDKTLASLGYHVGNSKGDYYMAVSHKDWELPNSRIWLAEIDIDRGLDFPI